MTKTPRKTIKIEIDNLQLPDELPAPEEALKTIAKAIHALETPGQSKEEIQKNLRAFKAYRSMFTEYVRCKRAEANLLQHAVEYKLLANSVETKARRAALLWPQQARKTTAQQEPKTRPTGR